jgi:hypothetical protein
MMRAGQLLQDIFFLWTQKTNWSIHNALEIWKQTNRWTLSEMLRAPDNDFHIHRASLLNGIRLALDNYVANADYEERAAEAVEWDRNNPADDEEEEDEV